jgi:hypothetical protein
VPKGAAAFFLSKAGARSGVKRLEAVREGPHLAVAAPDFQRPVIRFAGDVNCIDVVAGRDLPFAVDLAGPRIDEAQPVANHLKVPSPVANGINARQATRFQWPGHALAGATRRGYARRNSNLE